MDEAAKQQRIWSHLLFIQARLSDIHREREEMGHGQSQRVQLQKRGGSWPATEIRSTGSSRASTTHKTPACSRAAPVPSTALLPVDTSERRSSRALLALTAQRWPEGAGDQPIGT